MDTIEIRAEVAKSRGHLAFIGDREYFEMRGQVLRAPIAATVAPSGYRLGREYECFLSAWEEHRKTL